MFFDLYKKYVENAAEVPALFHDWCATVAISATLGKRFWFQRGHFNVYPNLYVMLLGSPGTGKGVSIGILQKLLIESGYRTFAADKSSKEKFLIDLQEGFAFSEEEQLAVDAKQVLSLESFFGDERADGSPAEVLIVAEEFNDFIGTNNTDFIALLTKLWSYSGTYRNRLKNSKSVRIFEPCVNIIGGNTSAGFALAFPPEIIGQGFLARLLPVYGENTGKRISFPRKPDAELGDALAAQLRSIREHVVGEVQPDVSALQLLDSINQQWLPLPDLRFQHYASRRFSQLIKLCLVQTASRLSTVMDVDDVRRANTLLCKTEDLMPKAIGEFGKARNSDVSSKIMEALWATNKPLSTTDLWKLVSSDLNQISELANLLISLSQAEKIQNAGKGGWLPRVQVRVQKPEFLAEVVSIKGSDV